MKQKILAIALVGMALISGMFVAPVKVNAVSFSDGISICDFIGPICTAIGISDQENLGDAGTAAYSFVRQRASLILSVVFIAIILLAVFIIIRAGITYIQSQGDEGKIGDAQKAIKNVFIGIAVMFVGIVGILLVLAFFGGLGLLQGTDEGCTIDNDGTVHCEKDI